MENEYCATVREYIDPRLAHINQYNMSVIGISKFKCDIETNDLNLLNEIVDLVKDFAEEKRKDMVDDE